MSARWMPFAALLGIVLLSAVAVAGPYHCFGGDESGDGFSTQSSAAPAPPLAVMAALVLIPIVALILAVGLLTSKPKGVEGEWVYTPEQWVFVPRQK